MLNLRSACYLLILINSSNSWSEVTLDGSLGTAGALSGPDYQITENLGQRAGSNLFHSFEQFNLQSAESATFSGNPTIQNVISRVTGGSPSSIDGVLRSTIPNANLYFLNPAGVFFGPNASLDVQGSFHVSTADYLGLADGTRFSTVLPNTNQVLTSALPEAFGFLGDNPGNITLAQAELEVPNGNSLSVIGGNIGLEGGQLIASAGRIDLASVSSKGEVVRQDNDLSLNGFNQLGKIELTQSAKVDTSGESGGAIFIRGGELTLNESEIRSDTLGGGRGQDVDIRLPQGTLELGNGGVIRAVTKGAGKSGDLFIESRNISLSHDGSESGTSFLSGSSSSGDAGDIKVKTESLELVNGATISSIATATSTGNGGDVFIEAASIRLSGIGPDISTGIATLAQSSGNAGDLTIQSNSLDVIGGATIFTSTIGSGNGGSVSIKAGQVRMTGRLSNISAISQDTGNSQDITIKSDSLEISDGAFINTAVSEGMGTGKSASLLIESKDIVLSGNNQPESFTGILGGSFNDSDAGKVTLITENLDIRNGAHVSTSAHGIGNGGDILVTADNILLSGHFSSFDSIAAKHSSGNAGKIIIQADNLELQDGSLIITSTFGTGNAGDLLVTAGNILIAGGLLSSNSTLDSSGDTGDSFIGDAGDIFIKTDSLVIRNPPETSQNTVSGISSNTNNTGNAGDITIDAGNILLTDRNTQIGALTSGTGNAGNVTLIADNLELRNGSRVTTLTGGSGNGGDLLITARNILLSGEGGFSSGVARNGSGNAGQIIINTDNLELRDGSIIATSTLGIGTGGDLLVTAGNILLSDGATLNAFTGEGDSGDAGKIDITTNNLEVRKESILATFTVGSGDGGDIIVKAGNLLLSGDGADKFTGISAGTGNGDTGDTGDAGDVTIVATHLDIRDGAMIETSTNGAGKGGNISIEGSSVLLSGDGSSRNTGLFSRSRDIGDTAGDAGKISITANDSLRILDRSFVLVDTTNANGGDIIISADHLLHLRDSGISTSVADGKGNGGNIFIGQLPDDSEGIVHAPNVTTLDNSLVIARAAKGRGGNIGITSDFIFRNNTTVSASSNEGVDGAVNINSPETNISGSIVALPENYINASDHLSKHCSVQTREVSSFVVKDRNTIPPGPDDASASTFFVNNPNQRFSGNRVGAENTDQFISTVRRENISKSVFAESGCGK